MHGSAERGMQELITKYVPRGIGLPIAIDIGSYNVNGSLRPMVERHGYGYIGVDIREGPGVDHVMPDAYSLPSLYPGAHKLSDVSLFVSCSCFEHCVNPWRLMIEIESAMSVGAMIVICAPFNWHFHEHPNDYYRYTHQGLSALCTEVGLVVLRADMSEPKSSGKQDAFVVAQKVR